MTIVYLLGRRLFLLLNVNNSVPIEHILRDGAVAGFEYCILVDCVPEYSFVVRACKLIRATKGCKVKLGCLADAQPRVAIANSAFAGTLKPSAQEPLLKASNYSPWHTVLMNHVHGSDSPGKTLILYGPPGSGKSLALARIQSVLDQKSVPCMYVSGADDDESDLLVAVEQYLCTKGADGHAVLFADDVDAFADKRVLAALLSLMARAQCRCVVVCNDRYADHMRDACKDTLHFRTQEVTAVDTDALKQHLTKHFPALDRGQIDSIAFNAHSDVRAAQLAAQLESLMISSKLSSASALDDQRHGALHTDIVRCVRAKRVTDACVQLLQPRAADAAAIMHTNYARLGAESAIDAVACMAEMQSFATVYEYGFAEAEGAYTFGRQAPDMTVQANIKEQIVFDLAVVAPCVYGARAAVPHQKYELAFEWHDARLTKENHRVATMCRSLDARHEMLVRRVGALAAAADTMLCDLSADEYTDLLATAHAKAAALLARAAADKRTPFASRVLTQTSDGGGGACQDGGGGGERDGGGDDSGSATTKKKVPMSGFISIDRLERTLFVFPLLVGAVVWSDAKQRKNAIDVCARYGFDATSFAYAAQLYVKNAKEDAMRELFVRANAPILYDERAAAIVEGADGGDGAAGAPQPKRKPASTATQKKRAKKEKAPAVPAAAAAGLDAWLVKNVQKPK